MSTYGFPMRATSVMLTASMIMLTVIGVQPQPSVALSPPMVVFVVGNGTRLPTNDIGPYEELVEAGFDVTVVDDDALDNEIPVADLVVISETVNPQRVGSHFNDSLTPVLTWEPMLFSQLGMTGAGAKKRGVDSGETMLDIVDSSHPMAAGLADRVAVSKNGATFSFGVPSPAATVVATIVNRPARPTIFHYAAGDEMVGGVAPAARTGFYLGAGAATSRNWLDEGRALFRAAVDHTIDDNDGDTNRAPTVDAGPDFQADSGSTVTLQGSVDDDGLPSGSTTVRWDVPDGVSVSESNNPTTMATFSRPGTFTLRLSADDGDLITDDAIVVTVSDPDSRRAALFIAGRATPTTNEQPAVDRLTDLGFDVVVADDNTVRATDGASADLIVISSTSAPFRLDRALAGLSVPMVVWEPGFFDELGFTADSGGQASGSSVRIVEPDHPIVAGLDGDVYTQSHRISWGIVGGDAQILALHPRISSKASLFLYEVGAAMQQGNAPARRVGMFLGNDGPALLTANGWTMFDRAVAWATVENEAPTVDAGTDITGLVSNPQVLAGTVLDDGQPVGSSVTSQWSGPAEVLFTDPGNPTTAVDATSPGTYTLTLQASDGLLTSSETVTMTFGNNPLTAAFETTIEPEGSGAEVQVDASQSIDPGGEITSYDWAFDDGQTASGIIQSHSFETFGEHSVTLIITDNTGAIDTLTQIIDVPFVAPEPERAEAGLITLYDFGEESSSVVFDVSGIGEPLDLVIADDDAVTRLPGGGIRIDTPTMISSQTAATKIIDAVGLTNEITVELFVDPAEVTSDEPGRLVTISPDDERRNVALNQGQKATSPDRFESRLRTTESGESGTPSAETPIGTSTDELAHLVFTRSNDGLQRLYLNGQLLDVARVNGDFSSWNSDWPLTFGAETTGEYPWRGDFHLAAFYDRALSHQEICANAAAGPGRVVAGTNRPPISCMLGDRMGGPAPHTVALDSTSSSDLDGDITAIEWDFGDGTTSSDTLPTHTYANDGDYTLALTITDDDGASTTSTTVIVVRDDHVAAPQPENFGETLGVRASGSFFELDAFERIEADLNRPIALTVQFLDRGSVSAMRSSSVGLLTRDDSDLLLVDDRVTLSITVPLGFGSARPRNTAGIAEVKANLVETASGAHDESYLLVAQRLVDAGYEDAILRVGNEFNGTFHAYSSREGNHEEFIAAWRHVHDVFESVSPDFRFDWTSLRGAFTDHGPIAWPGDEYVDFVGLDVYWRPQQGEPNWSDPTWEQDFRDVMQAHLDFAVEHGKQVSYSEWGVIGVDEPRFVEHMYDWFVDLPADGPGSLAFQSYFNAGNSRERFADYPDTKASYDRLFGLPAP